MDVTDVAQRLKLSFESPPRGSVSDAVALISASVREFSVDSFQACPSWLAPLEAKLLDVYENSVPHNSVRQLEGFLSVLFTLKSLLPASSIISWFDHLRTALREPRLGMDARQGLREMVGSALKDPAHSAESRSREFRRRLLELYLFDASPGGKSVQEVIEDLNRKTEEHEAEKAWKENLECILASDVVTSPNDSFAVLNVMFMNPLVRAGVATILYRVFSSKTRSPPVSEFSKSPLFHSFLTSLLVDHSASLFDQEVSTLISILPHMAVRCPESLTSSLGPLLVLLARAVCWKQSSSPLYSMGRQETEDSDNDDLHLNGTHQKSEHAKAIFQYRNDEHLPREDLQDYDEAILNSELNWERLGRNASDISTLIDASRYFTFIYGLYPCNTIAFLRRPIIHLQDLGFDSPFTVPWRDILDVDEIRSKSKRIIHSHAIHPGILYRDARSELSDPISFATGRSDTDDVARVVADCVRLDQSRSAADVDGMFQSFTSREGYSPRVLPIRESYKNTPRAREYDRLQPLDPLDVRRSSLSDHRSSFVDSTTRSEAHTPLIFSSPNLPASASSTSLLDTSRPTSSPTAQLSLLAQPSPLALSTLPLPDVEEDTSASPVIERSQSQDIQANLSPSREVTERAVILLQRENAQLREMCSFSVWLKNQMKHHVNRLHQDRIVTKSEEYERQGLHNRLREYKRRLEASAAEITKLKEQALRTQKTNRDWVTTLNDKIAGFRKEKASWLEEAVNLRGQITDAQNTVKAQSALLAEGQTKVADLTHELHFLNPKIEQLSQFERKIEELSKRANTEESDEIKQLRADQRSLQEARHTIVNLKLLIGSLKHANKELEGMVNERTSELRRVEQRLANPPRSPRASNAKTPSPRFRPASINGSPLRPQPPPSPDAEGKLAKLETENAELKEDVEALKVMVEMLRADGERMRIREANKARKKSASVPRSPRYSPMKGSLSAAEVSTSGEIAPEKSVPPLSLDR